MKHVSNHPCFPLWPLIFNLGGQLGYSIYSLTVYLRCTCTDGHCKATRGGVAYGVRCSQSGGNTAHPSFHSHRPPTHLPPACSATYRLPNTHSQRPENSIQKHLKIALLQLMLSSMFKPRSHPYDTQVYGGDVSKQCSTEVDPSKQCLLSMDLYAI